MMKHCFRFFLILSVLALVPALAPAQEPAAPQQAPNETTQPAVAIQTLAQSKEQPIQMREMFALRATKAKVERYESISGQPAFILDTSGQQTLFRYENSGEVLILTPVHTTRGDTIYKNDQGVAILRLRRVGSATIFPKPRSQGIVAWAVGRADQLGPPQISRQKMEILLRQIADDLAQELKQNIAIEIKGATDQSAWIFLDTARNLRKSVKDYGRQIPKRQPIPTIRKIIISVADRPSASFNKNSIILHVTPKIKYAGRLSSLQMLNALIENAKKQTSAPTKKLANSQKQ